MPTFVSEQMLKSSRRLYVYYVGIIDFWGGWSSLKNVVVHGYNDYEYEWPNVIEILANWELAKLMARKLDVAWEGDIRPGCGPFIAPLPVGQDGGGASLEYMIGWKQDNNGCTYIASTMPLPWLEEYDA
jgi:hypothetical protein